MHLQDRRMSSCQPVVSGRELQLAVMAATTGSLVWLPDGCLEKSRLLMDRSRSVLASMAKVPTNPANFLHMACNSSIFSPLHSLLTGCTLSIIVSSTPSTETQAVAGKLVSCTGAHLCIQAPLCVLAKSDDTALLDSCLYSDSYNLWIHSNI